MALNPKPVWRGDFPKLFVIRVPIMGLLLHFGSLHNFLRFGSGNLGQAPYRVSNEKRLLCGRVSAKDETILGSYIGDSRSDKKSLSEVPL